MIAIQTRRIFLDGREPTPWTTVDRSFTFEGGRARIIRLMQELGFYSYQDIILMVGELNPENWSGNPLDNYLTADNGNEIRVVPLAGPGW